MQGQGLAVLATQKMQFLVQFTAWCMLLLIAVRTSAHSTDDFETPPEWLAHGPDDSGGAGQGGAIEPINVIISAKSNVDPFNILENFASFSNCSNSVSIFQANVQTTRVDQFIGLRDGGCAQAFVTGIQLRAWRQTLKDGRIAFFIATSKVHPCRSDVGQKDIADQLPNWHCIDPKGFDVGRCNLTEVFNRTAAQQGSGFTVTEERAQLYNSGVGTDAGANSAVDHIPYDGKVNILVLSAVTLSTQVSTTEPSLTTTQPPLASTTQPTLVSDTQTGQTSMTQGTQGGTTPTQGSTTQGTQGGTTPTQGTMTQGTQGGTTPTQGTMTQGTQGGTTPTQGTMTQGTQGGTTPTQGTVTQGTQGGTTPTQGTMTQGTQGGTTPLSQATTT